jgi:lipopolysaccharide export system permease protein
MALVKRIDRMVLSEVVGPFFGSAALFTGLFLAAGEFMRFAEYVQRGESLLLIGQLFLLTLPGVVALTFPMAMLLGTLLGFGRMSGDSEVVAMIAAGVSFERIVVPVGVFALLVTGVGIWFNGTVVPTANHGRERIISDVKTKGGISLGAGQALDVPVRKDGRLVTLVHVEGGIERGPGDLPLLRQVSVERWDNGRLVGIAGAGSATWRPGTNVWTLSDDVWSANYDPKGGGQLLVGRLVETREVSLYKPEQIAALQFKVEELTNAQLRQRRDVLLSGQDYSGAREAEVEIARRVAVPFATLVFALIGAPLGVQRQRTGKGLGFGYSVLITFVYWMLLQFTSVLGRGGALPAGVAVMLPNLLGLGIAAYLIRRVLR